MTEPAYIEPDKDHHVRLNLAGVGTQTYYVDGPDENGVVHLVPVLDHHRLPSEVLDAIEEARRHPERLVRRARG